MVDAAAGGLQDAPVSPPPASRGVARLGARHLVAGFREGVVSGGIRAGREGCMRPLGPHQPTPGAPAGVAGAAKRIRGPGRGVGHVGAPQAPGGVSFPTLAWPPALAGMPLSPACPCPGVAITLDVETLRLAEEVGGWEHFTKLGIACCVVYDDETGVSTTFSDETGRHPGLRDLGEVLRSARRRGQPVIGHNVAGFDLPLIAHELAGLGEDASFIARLRVIDTIVELEAAVGRRVSLKNVTKRTNLGHKTMDGADAPMRWREGQHDEVIAYCENDVALEYALYRHCADGKPVRVWVTGPRKEDYATWAAFEAACLREVTLPMRPVVLSRIPMRPEARAVLIPGRPGEPAERLDVSDHP